MRKGRLVRTETDEDGTFGLLCLDTGFSCYVLERPTTGEYPCIPAGTYVFKIRKDSPKHGVVYEAEKVPGRTNIQIHNANWADELLGCLAPGRAILDIERKDGTIKKGVTSSKDACYALMNDLEKAPFELTISWKDGVNPKTDEKNEPPRL